MKSIVTILRVKQREIDALKRQQQVLESQRDNLLKTIDALAKSLEKEFKAAENVPGMAQFYGNFSVQIKSRQEAVRQQVLRVEVELDKLTQLIREAFSEMKKFELALDAHNKRIAAAAKRRENAEMDEIAIRGYVRSDVHGH